VEHRAGGGEKEGGKRRRVDLADCLEESIVIDREGLGFVDDTLRLESHLHVRVLLIQRRMALEAVKMKSSLVDAWGRRHWEWRGEDEIERGQGRTGGLVIFWERFQAMDAVTIGRMPTITSSECPMRWRREEGNPRSRSRGAIPILWRGTTARDKIWANERETHESTSRESLDSLEKEEALKEWGVGINLCGVETLDSSK
jgi:hypothetical protein